MTTTDCRPHKERTYYLDIIRILACAMVVLMHSPIPTTEANSLFLVTTSYLTAPCIGLFFMTSGALILPVRTDIKSFMKRRLTKVLYPTVVWSLFFIFISSDTWATVSLRILSMPFSSQGNAVMWFMYTIIGLYLISPILTGLIERYGDKGVRFYLAIWLLTTCFPIISPFLMVGTGNTSIFYYMSGYAGYYLMGYYLGHRQDKFNRKLILLLLSISLAVPIVCFVSNLTVDFYSLFWYLSIFVVMMAFCIFKTAKGAIPTLQKTDNRFKKAIALISNLSFGIYLVHLFIIRDWLWNVDFIRNIGNYPLQSFTIFIAGFILSVLFSYLVCLTPLGKYVIGFSKR